MNIYLLVRLLGSMSRVWVILEMYSIQHDHIYMYLSKLMKEHGNSPVTLLPVN